MASRPVVQQQNIGEAVPGAVKQKNMAVEKKNRRALGDIGNVVTLRGVDGKPLPQVSRPVTRSFCAKLLANAEAAEAENKKNEGRAHAYMYSQPEINERMRAILIDWLVQVHHKFDLSPETLYLTINIVDRFLASRTTSRRELQLVGLSSMLIASKYEEIWAPQVENMVYFLAELGSMNYSTLRYCPSMIAASAVYAARCTLNKSPLWNETLRIHTGFSEQQLMDCAKLLVTFHSMAADQNSEGSTENTLAPNEGPLHCCHQLSPFWLPQLLTDDHQHRMMMLQHSLNHNYVAFVSGFMIH
ncbi:UNVERIFIED_CONTAM: G2/mitotic-specific cyclin-2 [Sesamum latifolium]|uniref:G2/mitotic-specific cyclin-2 n=1 Tax=Sesamum latifolium TaxID=2727402 RepID=A0AAW2VH11_9LAMI